MSKPDWKSGRIPEAGLYLTKRPWEADDTAALRRQARGQRTLWLWIGPLPEKAPEPPAPTWGRGPVPADGQYLAVGREGEDLLDWRAGDDPMGEAWYGPVPDRPAAEEPAGANEWANLAKYRRCTYQPYVARCVLTDGHLGACRFANGDLARDRSGGRP